MADLGAVYTDKEIEKLTHKINGIYKEARKDINRKMQDFNKRYKVKEAKYAQQVKDGKMTQEQFDNWKKGQVFQGKAWQAKKDSITQTLYNSNKIASQIVNNERVNVFRFNFNYASYSMEHDTGINFGFNAYDKNTVINLIKNEPNLLPNYTPVAGIDKAWNSKKITRQVTLGIIEGENLDQIADRLAKVTSSQNRDSMLTHARTLMTGAQNAGRLESYRQAAKLGIDMEKQWMATFDAHTRDSHRRVDGETQPIEHEFSNKCMFPGDPGGPPKEVYNCRCTMVSDVKKYPAKYQRYDNIDGKPVDQMTYKDWYKAKYGKDLPQKKLSPEKQYQRAKDNLSNLEQHIKNVGADKIFKDIWQKDITYADWEEKKGSIEAKEQYYNEQVQKLKNGGAVIDYNAFGSKEAYEILAKYDSSYELFSNWDDFSKVGQALKDKGISTSNLNIESLWSKVHTEGPNQKLAEFEKKLSDLQEFKKNGEAYSRLLNQRNQAELKVKELKKQLGSSGAFGADSYSQARKDAALWAKSSKEADTALRPMARDAWQKASDAEKYAAWDYTAGSGGFNRPLRGYEGSWYNFKGIGQVDLDYEGKGKEIEELTNMISRSTLQQDTWLQRGIETLDGLANFVQVPVDDLRNLDQEDLEKLLLGKEITDQAFMSCGSAKGTGFSGSILNIYCPEGTQAIYCEPFSRYGNGGGKSWDGVSDQKYFGSELETLLQRGSAFKVTKVEKGKYGSIYLDLDLVDQNP